MPKRCNDPLGVSSAPHVTTDPERVAKISAETVRRIAYLVHDYHSRLHLGLTKKQVAAALKSLRDDSDPVHPPKSQECRTPLIELAIERKARELANLADGEALGPQHDRFVEQAARQLANEPLRRGPSGHAHLHRYVAGIMAIWQEATGTPLLGPKNKNGDYDPHLRGAGGELLQTLVDQLEPGIHDRTLALSTQAVRKKYAGTAMRFESIFPGYALDRGIAEGRLRVRHHGTSDVTARATDN